MTEEVLKSYDEKELVFSLDIGTRTVIGLVGYYEEDSFKILETEMMEHKKRNMYDGQIHDINGVVDIVKKVKLSLEQKMEIKLTKVAIAAAGRALKTYRAKVDREVDFGIEIDNRIIESLEMETIQKAQKMLDEELKSAGSKYYCVGYSVVNYYLDGNYIENLEGHKCSSIGADVIATFLPHIVVDSLYTVMDRVGLEVVNMTLEPIAAINVAIRKNLRLLNLALVDIGAGTSDIAITKDGAIVAYAMASVAGDEITENIAKEFLLGFDSAEDLKVQLNKQEEHEFFDIVGIPYKKTTDEIVDKVDKSIRNLAKEIAENILKYNEKQPSAVFLIGGGSQIPRLPGYIAENLELPEERVVVRGTEMIQQVDNIPDDLKGPQAITPIGIAVTAVENKYKDFLEITVNGNSIKLFNSKDIKVSNALVLVGYNPRNLIPKAGKSIKYSLNGIERVVRGKLGTPAKIFVNGVECNLETKLKTGDNVYIEAAKEGEEAKIKLSEIIDREEYVTFNNQKLLTLEEVMVNNIVEFEDIEIKDGDKIETVGINTVKDVLAVFGKDVEGIKVYKNGELTDRSALISNEDDIKIELIKKETIKVIDKSKYKTIALNINDEMKYIDHDKDELVFIDVFNYIDFDRTRVKGSLKLMLNGKSADYYDVLTDGDELKIYWERKTR